MTLQILNDGFIEQTLQVYGVSVSPELCPAIRTYVELLLRWNKKISLTAVTDPAEILRFHFGESMFAARQVPIRHGRLADVGSGAGFPAVPISMVVPELNCLLIESNQKKATFLAEIVRTLGLRQVEVFRGRMETLSGSAEKFDFSIARALGMHNEFLTWSLTHLNSAGKVIFWIGDQDASQIASNRLWKWEAPSEIPGSKHRVLLIGTRAA
jgi:16S rRNA (guanine527-N7)-methyltransferase